MQHDIFGGEGGLLNDVATAKIFSPGHCQGRQDRREVRLNAMRNEILVNFRIAVEPPITSGVSTVFTFPLVTIASFLVPDPSTQLVINDSNYPGTRGCNRNSDKTEFIKIRLVSSLHVDYGPFDRDVSNEEGRK